MMSNSIKRYQNKTENVIIKLYNPTLKEEAVIHTIRGLFNYNYTVIFSK